MKKYLLIALSTTLVLMLGGCASANEEISQLEESPVEKAQEAETQKAETQKAETQEIKLQEVDQKEVKSQEAESQEEDTTTASETDLQADEGIEISFRGTPMDKETNEALYSDILDLLNRKEELKLEVEGDDSSTMDVHDSITLNMTGEYETVLYRIKIADSWAYFEEKAREIYDDSYIQEVFTPHYLYNQYAEVDGKLYKVEAASIFGVLDEDSLKIWAQPGDNRYIATADCYYNGVVHEVYIIRKTDDEDAKYKIIADTEFWY